MQTYERTLIILYGPTGVGKSDMAESIARRISADIVNADMGQLYAPLTIGTAKPVLTDQDVPHHLFGVIDTPADCNVMMYRRMVEPLLDRFIVKKRIPLLVGGSGFYVHSLLFPPTALPKTSITVNGNWQLLYTIDPDRAKSIAINDTYRINRALTIWYATGIKPSSYLRPYMPPAVDHIYLIFADRESHDLRERIQKRTVMMIQEGWIDEVRSLVATPWQEFLQRKKLIGYNEIFEHLAEKRNLSKTIEVIQQKTYAYAKRQRTFWRMLERHITATNPTRPTITLHALNLTFQDHCLYIDQLVRQYAHRSITAMR